MAIGAIKRLVRRVAPDVLFLCDTKLTDVQMVSKRSSLGFPHGLAGSCRGSSGGVALFWRRDVSIQLVSLSGRHIDFLVLGDDGVALWRGTGLYGWPAAAEKYKTWDLLRFLATQSSFPWVVFGDWNAMLYPSEKQGGASFDVSLARDFHNCIQLLGLQDLGFSGVPFTWSNKRKGVECIYERLDRYMATGSWCDLFPQSKVTHVIGGRSDHLAILLDTTPPPPSRKLYRGYKFEKLWVKDGQFHDVVRDTWAATSHLRNIGVRLEVCNSSFTRWSKERNGNIFERVTYLRHQLESKWASHDDLGPLEYELHEAEEKLEAFWAQRAHHSYLTEGDKNTSYFHARAKSRSAKTVISSLQDEAGVVHSDFSHLSRIIHSYFQQIYTTNGLSNEWGELPELRGKISAHELAQLDRSYTRQEVEAALKEFHPSKAPGPDGMSALFFQQYWQIIGNDVVTMVLTALNSGIFEAGLNDTTIRLIPKIKNPQKVSDYRPISLCNVRLKLVSKVLANRIRPILDNLIESSQSAFVKGRLITDNFLIASELLHFLKNKRAGKQYAALKLDMSKAFDRVEWPFLEAVLKEYGLPQRWVNIAMHCVRTVSYKVLVNEGQTATITPSRGIRQGDPLSPYLFLFCMTGLSILMQRGLTLRHIHGVRICRAAPPLSHLFFADDTMLFLRATPSEAFAIKYILTTFERWTGQRVNFEKSELYVSVGVSAERKGHLVSILGVIQVPRPNKYLGLPALIGRSKEAAFGVLRERLLKKSLSYKAQGLSQAGRSVIIKSVFQAIPSYIMGVYKIPVGLCSELNGMMSRFFWKGDFNQRCLYWLPWRVLCCTKTDGGMGFRDLESFNVALLAKQTWRIMMKPNSLVARILKARYFPRTSIMQATLGYNPSFTWRSLLHGRDFFRQHCAWTVGDGTQVKVWGDRWLPGGRALYRSFPSCCPDDALVCDLLHAGTRAWDTTKLHQFFPPDIAEQICHVPIHSSGDDNVWWPKVANGSYTVNSGYKELIRCDVSSSSTPCHDLWQQLWKVPAHPRVLMLLWRLAWCILPTRWCLYNKHIIGDTKCPLCETQVESLQHLFIACPVTRPLWLRLELNDAISGNYLDINEWLRHLFARFLTGNVATFAYAIEGIWDARNQLVYNSQPWDIGRVLHRVLGSVQRFGESNLNHGLSTHSRLPLAVTHWEKPALGFIKLNFDASCSHSPPSAGVGIILRDDQGRFVGAKATSQPAHWPVELLEAMACFLGVEWASSRAIRNIHIEGDSRAVLAQLESSSPCYSHTAVLIAQTKRLLEGFDSVTYSWVPRRLNDAADRIAKWALASNTNDIWERDPPPWLFDVISA